MKKIALSLLVVLALGTFAGCTDAQHSSWRALGHQSNVTCYSGGQVVFQDVSTGKVDQINGGGITFISAKTGDDVRAFADCIVIVADREG